MPRDLSGNMTLVAGNPVTTGTAISSTVQNNTMADLAAEIQDSLSRSGKGGMTAPFKNADGTEGAPGLAFTNEPSSGWYRSAAGELRLAILGAWKFWYRAAGLIIKGALGLMDTGGTNKTVTLAPPSGLAADYTLTLPTGLPASTFPLVSTSAGVLSARALINADQAFGTPSADTDVVIKSYLAVTTTNVTSLAANLSNGPTISLRSGVGLAWFTSATNSLSASGAVTCCTLSGSTAGATALFSIPTGFRMPATGSAPVIMAVSWYDASGTPRLRKGALVCDNTNGNIYFWGVDEATNAKLDLANGDIVYLQGGAAWLASA